MDADASGIVRAPKAERAPSRPGAGAAAVASVPSGVTRAEIEAKLAAKPDWLVEKVRAMALHARGMARARAP